MTTQTIIDFAESLIGESMDADLALNLADFCKDLIELDRPWMMLIKEDATKTITPSDTYLTAKDLPTDFLSDYKVFVGSGDDSIEYDSIPFFLRRKFRDNEARYYIDHVNKKIHICGKVDATKSIYLNYIYQTPALNIETGEDASDPVWPEKFHKLISFMMAEIHQAGPNYDDITVKQALANNKEATLLYNVMVEWDARLRLKAMNNSAGFAGDN